MRVVRVMKNHCTHKVNSHAYASTHFHDLHDLHDQSGVGDFMVFMTKAGWGDESVGAIEFHDLHGFLTRAEGSSPPRPLHRAMPWRDVMSSASSTTHLRGVGRMIWRSEVLEPTKEMSG